jgi:uncharacterized protein YjiS (DUF1127 family)
MTTSPLPLTRRAPSPAAAILAARDAANGVFSAYLWRRKADAEARARYRQIRDEIARMPADMALDLGICRGDADELAQKAVPLR